jgi:hypothetical protein
MSRIAHAAVLLVTLTGPAFAGEPPIISGGSLTYLSGSDELQWKLYFNEEPLWWREYIFINTWAVGTDNFDLVNAPAGLGPSEAWYHTFLEGSDPNVHRATAPVGWTFADRVATITVPFADTPFASCEAIGMFGTTNLLMASPGGGFNGARNGTVEGFCHVDVEHVYTPEPSTAALAALAAAAFALPCLWRRFDWGGVGRRRRVGRAMPTERS